jgi:hypothetical protein
MVARKVTGDRNVPKNEITFQVDLNPFKQHRPTTPDQESHTLQPIILTDKAAKKWGTKKLPRHAGLGHVAEEGFRNNKWLEGQLIIIGDEYFSFAWLPIEQQIFFGRPSAELSLKMMRDASGSSIRETFESPPSLSDDVELQKKFVLSCLEKTNEFEDDREDDGLGCIWRGLDGDQNECHFG